MNSPSLLSIGIVLGSYLLSIIAGHFLVVFGLDFFLGGKGDRKPHPRAWGVGCIERFIYTSSLLLGLPIEIIGGWLVLKGIAQFRPNRDDKASTDEFLNDYYGYLVGTGLSLILGVGFGLLGRYLLGLPLMDDKK
jgi:hypothetical protein